MKRRIFILSILLLLSLFSLAYGEKPIKERLYIGGKEGLYILGFESKTKLNIKARVEKDREILVSTISGDYLFLGYKMGIGIYSLSGSNTPRLISKFIPRIEEYPYPSSYPHDIFIERNRAYIPYGISGLLILDIENKKLPKKIGIYNDNTIFYNAVARERYVYASTSTGLIIIDVRNPGNPKYVKNLITYAKNKKKKKSINYPIPIELKENYLIAGEKDTVFVYDIKNPEDPVLVEKKKVGDVIRGFYLKDDYLFIIDDRGFTLRVYEFKVIKKKTKKGEKSSINIEKKGVFKAVYPILDLVYFRDRLYLAMGKYGIQIVDMDTIEKIVKRDRFNIYTDCVSISSDEKFIYAVDTEAGLIVIDKEKIVPINWYRTLREARDFYRADRYGYLLEKRHIFSLSIKEDGEPYKIDSTWKIPKRAFRIYVDKDRLYVVALDYGLFIYSLKKDPTFPKLIKKYATDGNLYDIYIDGNLLYLADGKAGFYVIDVTDTENIKIIRKYKTKTPLLSIFKIQDVAYLGEKDGTFTAISLENPKKIDIIGSKKFTSPIVKIVKYENYLFLAAGFSGVKILKVESPYITPKIIGEIDTDGYVWDIEVKDRKIWIADGENGVTVYDIKDIQNPKKIGDLDWFSADNIEIK